MNHFDIKPNELYHTFKKFQENGCGNMYFEDQEYNGHVMTLHSKQTVHFANCSYMGLERHPSLIDGAVEALKSQGTQVSVSRSLLSTPLYAEVDMQLQKIFQGYPVVYGSTTLAHYAALPILVGEDDAVIIDAFVHNSVRTACELCKSRGAFMLISRHNDMEHLRFLIKRLKKEGYKKIWYCADGIYSMHGDVCDVKGLQQLLDEEENFYAYVDDAHGVGWTGKNGSGFVIGNFGLHNKMIVAGSLSKSFVVSGGFLIIPDKELADYIKLTSHTYIFSSPLSPAVLGAVNASLKLCFHPDYPKWQQEVVDVIHYFKDKCKELSLSIYSGDITPIQLIKIGDYEKLLKVQKHLVNNGFFPTVAAFPAVSLEDGGIRVSLTRHITRSDIDRFLATMKEVIG
jgi:7-keto-8-aminopelargonate synthetase-like enzyme